MTTRRWLAAIVLVAAGLRCYAIGFGLPYAHARPDETTTLGLARQVRAGDLNPHSFHWGSLSIYTFAAVHAAVASARRLAGVDPALDSATLVISARAAVALAGTLTVLVLFRLTSRMAGATAGLLSAFFLSVSILHVRESHFAMTDVLMTFFLTASLALLLEAMAQDDQRRPAAAWYAAAGLAGGLAASTKYSAAAVVAAMGAAQLDIGWRHRSPVRGLRVLAPSAAFAAAFVTRRGVRSAGRVLHAVGEILDDRSTRSHDSHLPAQGIDDTSIHRQAPMRAIAIAHPGGPEVLQLVDRPTPTPAANEVLVRVEAAGVNRPDLMQRVGTYPPPPGISDLPGLEVAGTIAALGPGVTRWREGDTVCALVAGGGYAEYCVVPEPQALPLPHRMRAEEAAAIPETFFTVWTNLFERGRLTDGERVLIHGGSSGIGTTAIQLARAFGATVFATAGSDDKCAACERLGARAINYRTADFVKLIKDWTDGAGVDVILDIVGGSYLPRNLNSLAMHGRLLQIGLLESPRAEINLRTVMQKRLTLTGSTLRIRSVEEKGAIARALEARVWPLLASRQVAPVIHASLPLADAARAHQMLESGDVIGKVVLVV